MDAGIVPLLSTLLGLLLLSTPGTRGANPALVARITDKGLEYGKKPDTRLSQDVEDVAPLVGRLLRGSCGGDSCDSGRVTPQRCDLSTLVLSDFCTQTGRKVWVAEAGGD